MPHTSGSTLTAQVDSRGCFISLQYILGPVHTFAHPQVPTSIMCVCSLMSLQVILGPVHVRPPRGPHNLDLTQVAAQASTQLSQCQAFYTLNEQGEALERRLHLLMLPCWGDVPPEQVRSSGGDEFSCLGA
jgi:hypothetical protein